MNVDLNEVAISLLIRLKMCHMFRTFEIRSLSSMRLNEFVVILSSYFQHDNIHIRLHDSSAQSFQHKAQYMRHTKTNNCYIFCCRVIVQLNKKKAAKLLIHSWAAFHLCRRVITFDFILLFNVYLIRRKWHGTAIKWNIPSLTESC